jgi:hypothetical protein
VALDVSANVDALASTTFSTVGDNTFGLIMALRRSTQCAFGLFGKDLRNPLRWYRATAPSSDEHGDGGRKRPPPRRGGVSVLRERLDRRKERDKHDLRKEKEGVDHIQSCPD